jgi:hypothetical protein
MKIRPVGTEFYAGGRTDGPTCSKLIVAFRNFANVYKKTVLKADLDSIVDVATRFGLDGPGFETRWGEIFRTHPDRP